jgi:3'-5' exonuclease
MQGITLKNYLFLDIETVSQQSDFELLAPQMQEFWERKSRNLKNEENLDVAGMYFDRAGIYAEFGKIVCISVGIIYEDEVKNNCLRIKTLANHNEAELLQDFNKILAKHQAKDRVILCAHNGKEFDFPYLCRRMLVNGIELPTALQMQGKKPWEINHADTLDFWKFGDFKHYTGLDLLATIFGLKSSKDDISGDEVNRVYHRENNLERIATYCGKDVVVLTQLFLKMNALPIIEEEFIQVV